jgi:hypothetical protein
VRQDEVDWHEFSDLAGTHAKWRQPDHKAELTSTEGQVLATLEPASVKGQVSLSLAPRIGRAVESCTYENRRNGKQVSSVRAPFELVDVTTGQRILRVESMPENRSVFGQIQTSSHNYAFPVQGERQRYATMSAVDEVGHTALRYREEPGRLPVTRMYRDLEIVISPDQAISVELCCLLAVTRSFLWFYFNHHYPH